MRLTFPIILMAVANTVHAIPITESASHQTTPQLLDAVSNWSSDHQHTATDDLTHNTTTTAEIPTGSHREVNICPLAIEGRGIEPRCNKSPLPIWKLPACGQYCFKNLPRNGLRGLAWRIRKGDVFRDNIDSFCRSFKPIMLTDWYVERLIPCMREQCDGRQEDADALIRWNNETCGWSRPESKFINPLWNETLHNGTVS